MGKVTIVESLSKGQYIVAPVYNEKTYAEMRAAAVRQESLATDQLGQIESDITDAESELQAAQSALDIALEDLIAGIQSGGPSMTPAYQEALSKRQNARAHLSELEALRGIQTIRRDEARHKIATLDAKANPEPRLAWCADFIEDATGEAASIEVPGEPQAPIIIYPQFSEGQHQPERDGLLAPREWQTGSQVYFNAAILPGWQKFKPTYRIGEILSVDKSANTATVDLDDAFSSAQSLPIVQNKRLAGIPIRYMDCNAAVFEAGDRVVVRMHMDDDPTIIGFESNPRPCGFFVYAWDNELLDAGGSPLGFVSGAETIRINAGEIDAATSVLTLTKAGNFSHLGGNWPGARFAIHGGKTYSATYTDPSFSERRQFFAGEHRFDSVPDGGVPGIACSSEKVFTMLSGRPDNDQVQIKVWSIDGLELLGQWSSGIDCEALYDLAASENQVAIPITLPDGDIQMHIYSHSGVLNHFWNFSSPYRPMAICSDGTDFAVTVEQVLGSSDGAAEVWVLNSLGQIERTVYLDGTVGSFNRRAFGVAMTQRFLAVSLSGLGLINIYDRQNNYDLVAVRDGGPDQRWVDLNVDSAIRQMA